MYLFKSRCIYHSCITALCASYVHGLLLHNMEIAYVLGQPTHDATWCILAKSIIDQRVPTGYLIGKKIGKKRLKFWVVTKIIAD